MGAGGLAVTLDREMLEARGIAIAPSHTATSALPVKPGSAVATELGGRLLVRYLIGRQVGAFAGGSTQEHFVTPTPLASTELNAVLALPAVRQKRSFALLLDPAQIGEVRGPRWVRFGSGIEYVLPSGFPAAAVASRWEVRVG